MTNTAPSLLYRFLWLLALCCVPYTLVLTIDLITHPLAPDFHFGSVTMRLLLGLIGAPLTVIIGLLIIRRKPGNVVGPMLVIWGGNVATVALRADMEITTAAVLGNISSVGWGILIVLGFYFPTGQIVPVRWHRWITWVILVGVAATFLAVPTIENLSYLRLRHPNPLYLPFLQPFRDIFNFTALLPILLMPLMVYSVYRRYKQANPVEGQQIRLAVFAFFLLLLLTPLNILAETTAGMLADIASIVIFGYLYFFPAVVIGNAILRHKLYDIDIIIRRTLIYTVLTTILGVVYFGSIVLTQQVFRAVTGQSSEPAIVVSTLLIAALFAPLRRRVQDVIDRRLYRKKYDAEKVLADFQKNLRDEVDMETLKANLLGVLEDTMQPTKIALWVKESPKPPTS